MVGSGPFHWLEEGNFTGWKQVISLVGSGQFHWLEAGNFIGWKRAISLVGSGPFHWLKAGHFIGWKRAISLVGSGSFHWLEAAISLVESGSFHWLEAGHFIGWNRFSEDRNVAVNLGSMSLRNAFGDPNDVAVLLFLEPNIGVENAKVELVQERLLHQHDLQVYRWRNSCLQACRSLKPFDTQGPLYKCCGPPLKIVPLTHGTYYGSL